MAERVNSAFDDHFRRTADQPDFYQQMMISDRESSYSWEREGSPVVEAIEIAANIPRRAAEDIQAILEFKHGDFDSVAMGEETKFDSESYYEEMNPSDDAWQEEWRTFGHSLRTEARFFNHLGAAHLASVFGNIDKLNTRDGRSLVVNAGPDLSLDHFFRARVFQSDAKLQEAICRPDINLGPPPASLAIGGRMNAQGIAVFYGATDVSVAIAEVRPPVGSKVVICKFNIIRPLRLLDLTALEHVQERGSIFDPSYSTRIGRAAFLRSLGQRITRPILPDEEALEYLPTQAIADFLATQNDPRLDGILFRSVQSEDGQNVVLFHEAAGVEVMELPEGTEVTSRLGQDTQDGWEVEYSVTECVPSVKLGGSESKKGDRFDLSPQYIGSSRRRTTVAPSLRVDPLSVTVNQIEWVKYEYDTETVSRHRYEKSKPEF